MKKARIKNNNKNKENVMQKEEYSLKKIVVSIIILIIIFLAFYFITTLVVKPVETNNDDNIAEIDSSKITLSNLLDRKEKEYYVLAIKNSLYSSSSYTNINYQEIYNKYIKDYEKNDGALTVYIADLDDALNKNYTSDELKITDNLQELELNNEVLFKIKEGKIEEYYVGNSEIVKALSSLQNENN